MAKDGVEESDDITTMDPRKLDQEAQIVKGYEKLLVKRTEIERKLIESDKKLLALGISPLGNSGATKPDDSRVLPKTGKSPVKSSAESWEKQEIKRLDSMINDLKIKLDAQDKKFDMFDTKLGKAGQAISDPVGFAFNMLTKGSFITKLLGSAGAVIALYEIILTVVKKMFEDGGAFDIRLRVRDELKAYGPLQKILDIRSGRVFFAPDTSIYQGTALSSNGGKNASGTQRFNRLHSGATMGDMI